MNHRECFDSPCKRGYEDTSYVVLELITVAVIDHHIKQTNDVKKIMKLSNKMVQTWHDVLLLVFGCFRIVD